MLIKVTAIKDYKLDTIYDIITKSEIISTVCFPRKS